MLSLMASASSHQVGGKRVKFAPVQATPALVALRTAHMHLGAYSSYRTCVCLGSSVFIGGITILTGARAAQHPPTALGLVAVGLFIMLIVPVLYWQGCRRSRDEEAVRTVAHLTKNHVYLIRYFYSLGCCCYRSTLRVIPLDRIQDVALSDNWLANLCAWSAPGTTHFKMEIQSAGSSGGKAAELIVLCIEDPDGFRNRVLAARRSLMGKANPRDLLLMEEMEGGAQGGSVSYNGIPGGAAAAGAAKTSLSSPAVADALLKVSKQLERLEAATQATPASV